MAESSLNFPTKVEFFLGFQDSRKTVDMNNEWKRRINIARRIW